MKTYKKGGNRIYHYEFETLHQFLNETRAAKFNERVFDVHNPSSRGNSASWAGTSTYEEAVELCQKGWSENFDKLVRLKKRIDEKVLSPIVKPRQISDIVGYNPSVPDWLLGNPLNMWNSSKKQVPTFMDIYLNMAYNCGTGRDEIFNRGIVVQSLVDALQDRGYIVRFKTCICVEYDDEVIFAVFRLKGEGEKLNIRKTYFPLCHPAFFRRLVFRLMETTPVTHTGWESGYGRTTDSDDLREIINPGPNDIVITQPSEIGVRGYDIDDDLEAILKFTNLQEILAKA